jgi:thioredoxin 1
MVRLVVLFAALTCVPAFDNPCLASFTSLHRPSVQNRMVSLGAMINLADTNYETFLKGQIVLVDACAQWCGPCKLIEPVLDRCMEKWQGTLHMAKFDVEAKNPNLKLEFLLQDVMPKSLPCLVLFKDGKALAKHNGVITDEELDDFIETNLQGTTSLQRDQGVVAPKKQAGMISLSQNDSDDYMLSNF